MDRKVSAFTLGLLWVLFSGMPAIADDVELFGGSSSEPQSPPNILLVIDNSLNMAGGVLAQAPYDKNITYSGGGCDKTNVYWSTNGTPPSCATNSYFKRTGLQCKAALDAFGTSGTYWGRLASYNTVLALWEQLDTTDHNRKVECEADLRVHGEAPGLWAPRNGDVNQLWTEGDDQLMAWGASPTDKNYFTYDGNWLAWYFAPGPGGTTRLGVVQQVARDLVATLSGVNIGMVTLSQDFDNTINGGRVAHEINDIDAARAGMVTEINVLTPSKSASLSETLYEATLYLMGRDVNFGLQAPQSVAPSRLSGNQALYDSPIETPCQKTHVVYLTSGVPRSDSDADALITSLTDSREAGSGGPRSIQDLVSTIDAGGQCDAEMYPTTVPPLNPSGGQCLDDLAEFLHEADLSPLPGEQNAIVHTVGFAPTGFHMPVLQEAAERGGGSYYEATTAGTLTAALQNIVTEVLDTRATFTAPTVSINTFNRTRSLNDVFISVFEPSNTVHWPGNLKKFRLRPSDAAIVDSAGAVAVDPETGFFTDTARSFWLPSGDLADGGNVEAGGAANKIPATRKVYTYITDPDLTAGTNAITDSNHAFDPWLVTGPPGPAREAVIQFINGVDAANHDNDGNTTEPRYQMGDPLHSESVAVTYNDTTATVYFATNDGFLHAIDSETGVEKWAFVPRELLQRQVDLFTDATVPEKTYGIDGSLRVQSIGDNDGLVEKSEGERVYLFFGMRRGGDAYYALDVTDPVNPTVLWRHDRITLPGVLQSWSSATPARMNTDTSEQSDSKLVVVFGGGYDPSQDEATAAIDDSGNSIFIVDSENGNVLWHGSRDGADADFDTDDKAMDYSIPADVKVIDFDGDGFADRMYAADMGGQVWRFDIFNGEAPSELITGGVIAQLGSAPDPSTASVANTRRFYYSPDVAMVTRPDLTYVHIGIGSGHRAHPLSVGNADRFYALRDTNGLRKMLQDDYDIFVPTTDAELTPVTSPNQVISSERGWKLQLNAAAGEKILAEARTFNDQVFFTTFTPSGAAASPCSPALGTNRLYVMNVVNGAPVTNLDKSTTPGPLTFSDISTTVRGSISSQVVFLFPTAEDIEGEPCTGDACNLQPVACVDLFCMPTGFGNNPVRTFWRQERVE